MTALEVPYDAVLITGTVGAGKTTTASALSDLEAEAGRPHAFVDLDQIRLLRPPPDGDPFQHEVELANLRDLARNYRRAGARRLVLAGVVEQASELPRYADAIAAGRLLVCRLTVDGEEARRRLRLRHRDDREALAWHLHRTGELTSLLDSARFEHVTVDTTRRTSTEAAMQVRRLAGWT